MCLRDKGCVSGCACKNENKCVCMLERLREIVCVCLCLYLCVSKRVCVFDCVRARERECV